MSEIQTRKGLKGVSEGNSTVYLERSTKVKILLERSQYNLYTINYNSETNMYGTRWFIFRHPITKSNTQNRIAQVQSLLLAETMTGAPE